ncbi:amino acid/polyamine/organocation transporter, APC superfamily (TC 2.A.3) [Paenibacillus uliginis N3/975]|uniref:Amino acid/polyamine/organocation transporter, APC superfamily (TC 2.A.3) n=1 Tax=Paenibacillus uliginis N3/975 TaxID=1313296 RepID=A0A1X7HC99_9BACL|nr:amino acid permease [Paenibacillus uliginis]SMF83824.1 amino acid/polyamine/organocation transporter, APC superfamily (TC 2.A.3) [Paenibacillus uliginis N3/975]
MGQAEGSLQKKLKPRHISFMAMGGVIGTGIFKGSAETIGLAGPGVIMSYIFAGLLLLVVMAAMAEMATVYPNRNMKDFVREAFGEKVSFIMGWMYCFMWLSVCVIEVIAAGSFLQYWFTEVPLWLLSLACAAFIVLINLMSVGTFGEFEFWLAGIKIAMIIIFIVLGVCLIFGVIPSDHTPYLQNFTNSGGFLPNGWTSVFSALLVVMFSYGGSELIGLTLTETENAERILPKVVGNFILRIILFFTLPILIICGLIPWNQLGPESSPFVQVLTATGLSGAAHIMNFILITAVLSAANSGIYGASRMLYSMAAAGEAPKSLARTNRKGSPVNTLLLLAVILLAGSLLGLFAQDQLFRILMAVPGFVVILVWICIALSQLKLRKQYPVKPAFKVWGYPYVTGFVVVCLTVIATMFLFDSQNRFSIGTCLGVLLILIVSSFVKFRPNRDRNENECSEK